MKNKLFGVQSIPEVTENWAQWRQISGRSSASHTGIELQDQTAGWRQRITSWRCLVLLFVVGLPAMVCAQKAKDSWPNLNGLKAGQGIEVIESSMKSHSGQFVTVTDEMLSLQEKGSDISIKREDIVRVSTSSAPRRGEHAVIGLVVGGAIGAGIGAAAASKSGWTGVGALIGVALGAPSGALVGAVIPAHTTVYRAPGTAHQTTSP